MNNLRSARALTGHSIRATNGLVGRAGEFYFDDRTWIVRYLVAELGSRLHSRRVLLPAPVLLDPDWDQRQLAVSITSSQVRACADAETDLPVARQPRPARQPRYGWDLYLGAEAMVGPRTEVVVIAPPERNRDGKPFDRHLRSTRVVTGLAVRAQDGVAGHVDDFIVDDANWAIRYLVVDLGGDRRVLLLPGLVLTIDIEHNCVRVGFDKARILDCPALDPGTLVTRKYERAVHEHFGLPGYWAA